MINEPDAAYKKAMDGMDVKYKNAHRKLQSIEKSLSKKDLYFILKKHYSFQESGYKPEFPI